MIRSLRWILAGTVAGTGLILLGCSSSSPPAPSTPPKVEQPFQATQVGAYLARDYYFPSSATMRAVYSFTATTQLPSQNFATSGRMTVEVVSYSPTRAVLRSTVTTTGQNARTDTNTTTVRVEPDGTVVAEDGGSVRHSNAVFTAAGDMVAPASGSEIPEIRARMVGTEAVTVPAGTYQTVHLQEGPAVQGATPTDIWLARGVGIVRQHADETFTIPAGQGQGQGPQQTQQAQQGRSVYDMRLESFTP
ncbi:MAG TPA: hypothetical protein V6D05_00155 [Stenomitos sp.]